MNVVNTPDELDRWIKECDTEKLKWTLQELAEMVVHGEASTFVGLEPEERMRRYAVEIERRNERIEHPGGL